MMLDSVLSVVSDVFVKVNSPPCLLQLDLRHEVVPSSSRAVVTSGQLELHLAKAEPGRVWESLTVASKLSREERAARRAASIERAEREAKQREERLRDISAKDSLIAQKADWALSAQQREGIRELQARARDVAVQEIMDWKAREVDQAHETSLRNEQKEAHENGAISSVQDDSVSFEKAKATEPSAYSQSSDAQHTSAQTRSEPMKTPHASANTNTRSSTVTTGAPLPPPRSRAAPVKVSFTARAGPLANVPARELADKKALAHIRAARRRLGLEVRSEEASVVERQAQALKEQGDAFAHNGDLDAALGTYSAALKLDAFFAEAIANRAATYLIKALTILNSRSSALTVESKVDAMTKHRAWLKVCISDCTNALRILRAKLFVPVRPFFFKVKLLLRRASALALLGLPEQAIIDARYALALRPCIARENLALSKLTDEYKARQEAELASRNSNTSTSTNTQATRADEDEEEEEVGANASHRLTPAMLMKPHNQEQKQTTTKVGYHLDAINREKDVLLSEVETLIDSLSQRLEKLTHSPHLYPLVKDLNLEDTSTEAWCSVFASYATQLDINPCAVEASSGLCATLSAVLAHDRTGEPSGAGAQTTSQEASSTNVNLLGISISTLAHAAAAIAADRSNNVRSNPEMLTTLANALLTETSRGLALVRDSDRAAYYHGMQGAMALTGGNQAQQLWPIANPAKTEDSAEAIKAFKGLSISAMATAAAASRANLTLDDEESEASFRVEKLKAFDDEADPGRDRLVTDEDDVKTASKPKGAFGQRSHDDEDEEAAWRENTEAAAKMDGTAHRLRSLGNRSAGDGDEDDQPMIGPMPRNASGSAASRASKDPEAAELDKLEKEIMQQERAEAKRDAMLAEIVKGFDCMASFAFERLSDPRDDPASRELAEMEKSILANSGHKGPVRPEPTEVALQRSVLEKVWFHRTYSGAHPRSNESLLRRAQLAVAFLVQRSAARAILNDIQGAREDLLEAMRIDNHAGAVRAMRELHPDKAATGSATMLAFDLQTRIKRLTEIHHSKKLKSLAVAAHRAGAPSRAAELWSSLIAHIGQSGKVDDVGVLCALWCNRAASHFAAGRFLDASADCAQSIVQLDKLLGPIDAILAKEANSESLAERVLALANTPVDAILRSVNAGIGEDGSSELPLPVLFRIRLIAITRRAAALIKAQAQPAQASLCLQRALAILRHPSTPGWWSLSVLGGLGHESNTKSDCMATLEQTIQSLEADARLISLSQ